MSDGPAPDEAFLVAAGVRHAYAGTPVLVDVDLALPRGSLTCLIGPTGCGKTTLLRTLAGFIQPDAGTIHIGGRDVSVLDPSKRGIGFVYQDLALFSHMSVRGNVGFGLRARGVRGPELHRRVGDILQRVGLAGFEGRRPATLSGGQRQRVALARALVFEPDILLLDEPFTALDKNVRSRMQQEVKRLQRDLGITTMLVTHDQQEALRLADLVVVMRQGRIVQFGPPRELYQRPATVFVAQFLGDANLFEGAYRQEPERLAGTLTIALGAVPAGLAEGAAAVAMVRPEDVALSAERPGGPDGEAALAAVVEEVAFTGVTTEYALRTRSGHAAVRALAAGGEGRTYAQGAEVWLSFPRERVTLIPEEPQ